MRIVLDGLHILPGRTGGGETYLRGLLSGLSEIGATDRLTVKVRRGFDPPDVGRNVRFRYHPVERSIDLWRARHRRLAGLLPGIKVLHDRRMDLIHWVNGVMHPPPTFDTTPAVVTVFDAQHIHFPGFFSPEDLAWRDRVYRYTVDHADHIISISEATKRDLIAHYGADAGRITVIPLGIDPGIAGRVVSEGRAAYLRRKHGLGRPFYLYPANTWPHKNHVRLVEAYALARRQKPGLPDLILTGSAQNGHRAVMDAIDKAGMAGIVRHIGYIERADLLDLYRLTEGVIFPSLFEGFGLPVIEALGSGARLAVADLPVFEEILPGTVRRFDPASCESLAGAIRDLGDQQLPGHGSTPRVMDRFMFPVICQQHLRVYRLLVGH